MDQTGSTISDIRGNLRVLRGVSEQLSRSGGMGGVDVVERWGTLGAISERISEACADRDLVALVRAQRDLRNKTRRPAIRRELAEAAGSGKDKQDGVRSCSQCGAVIDGSDEMSLDDALCSKCALSRKNVSDGKGKSGETKRSVSSDGEKKSKNDRVGGLRRRGYVK